MVANRRVAAALCALSALSCGPKTLQAKMNYAENRAEKAGGLLDEAEHALDTERPEDAESRLADARKILTDPDVQYYPERDMLLSRLKDDETRVPEVRKAIAKRLLDEAVAKRRKQVDDATVQVKKAVDDLHAPGLGSSQVKSARNAIDDLKSALDGGKDLEAKDKGYADRAKQGRKYADEAATELKQSEKTVAFLEGPGASRKDAQELHKKADGEKDPHKRLEDLKGAHDKYKACGEDGRKMVLSSPELKKAVIVSEESVTSPEGILGECIKAEQALAKPIALQEKIVAFVDGPGAARKQGEDLAKSAETEQDPQKKVQALKGALGKYKTCITQGKKLTARSKELKTAMVPLDEVSMLPEKWVADCVEHGTALDKEIVVATKAAKDAAKAAALAAKKARKKS